MSLLEGQELSDAIRDYRTAADITTVFSREKFRWYTLEPYPPKLIRSFGREVEHKTMITMLRHDREIRKHEDSRVNWDDFIAHYCAKAGPRMTGHHLYMSPAQFIFEISHGCSKKPRMQVFAKPTRKLQQD